MDRQLDNSWVKDFLDNPLVGTRCWRDDCNPRWMSKGKWIISEDDMCRLPPQARFICEKCGMPTWSGNTQMIIAKRIA